MSITLPKGINIPQENPLSQLLSGLGTGFAKGAETSLAAKLKAQQQGMTPFQQLSTEMREKEQKRKISNSVRAELNTLSEIKKGVVLPQDVPSVESDIVGRIQKGEDPSVAFQSGMMDYTQQRASLGEMDVPKFNAKKVKEQSANVVNELKENNITNPTVINRKLKAQKWPTKARKELLKDLKGMGKAPVAEKKEPKVEAKSTTNRTKKMPSPIGLKGRFLTDHDSGIRYKSDGKKWVEIK